MECATTCCADLASWCSRQSWGMTAGSGESRKDMLRTVLSSMRTEKGARRRWEEDDDDDDEDPPGLGGGWEGEAAVAGSYLELTGRIVTKPS
jgi:hypothetical protein